MLSHDKRGSGIILHVTSLPGPYGVGTMGKHAYAFVDFLARARQRYWQVLPLSPTSYADSPYQSFSTFAGNPYLIDLDALAERGLLSSERLAQVDWGVDEASVDYGKLYENRFLILGEAYFAAQRDEALMREMDAFGRDNAAWLDDYALFMALKDENGGAPWSQWPRQLRLRESEALEHARVRLAHRAGLYRFIQYLFFTQWNALRAYAGERGVSIIGDVPIYVPLDSADVWSAPFEFLLDEERRPLCVAGVPPDYFTADGQLWGNPIYDWPHMKEGGFAWWKRRLEAAARLYDVIRIDHFRGLASYWSVAPDAPTARVGQWLPGPGLDFVEMIHQTFPDLFVIAEDLGLMTPDVQALLAASGFPGMKVLEFAFDTSEQSVYLPHSYPPSCVCYGGTHDNDTIAGWLSHADPHDVDMARRYLGLNADEGYVRGFIRGGMSSVATLFLTQMQDWLGLGSSCRMNLPGTREGNWVWRMREGMITNELADEIAAMTRLYERA